jgi:hypothetical protein
LIVRGSLITILTHKVDKFITLRPKRGDHSFYICDMLNVGLIGDIKLLEPFTQKVQKNPEIYITGKSSVGTQPKPASFRLQAPEYNRIELIERSDALFINRFSLLPFSLLCEMVKKSKHIFAASYPDLSPGEISQLAKLAHEAKTVIQVANPLYYMPAVQWMVTNLKKPAYVDIQYFSSEVPEKNTLLQLLLMLKDMAGTLPKKIGAVSFNSAPANSIFHNVQLDYGDGSLINLNYGKRDSSSRFEIKIYMNNLFAEFDLINDKYIINNLSVNPSKFVKADETDSFLNAILHKRKVVTDIESYSNALQSVAVIQERLNRYISH